MCQIVSNESIDFEKSVVFPNTMNSKAFQTKQNYNTGMYNVEQDVRFLKNSEVLIDSRSIEDVSNESVNLKKSVESEFPDMTDSNIRIMQCHESNTNMYVEQDIRIFEDNDESINLRNIEAINDKSIGFEKSVQLFTNTMDSKILYQESNTGMSNVELNVEFSNDKKYSEIMDIDDSNDSENMDIDDSNDSKSMHYGESIDFEKSAQSFPDTMDSDIQEMQYQVSNADISNVENGVEDDEYFKETIEKSSLNKDDIKENLPEGRRIVDFAFLWKKIHTKYQPH